MRKKRKFRSGGRDDASASETGRKSRTPGSVSAPGPDSPRTPSAQNRGGAIGETLPKFRAIDPDDLQPAPGPDQPRRRRKPRKATGDAGSTGGREISLLGDLQEKPAEPSGPPGVETGSAGGDTLRMPSIPMRPDGPAAPGPQAEPQPGPEIEPQPAQTRRFFRTRVDYLPRKRFKARGGLGFFSFIFGLFGLVIKMTIVTLLVFAIGGVAGYKVISLYVKGKEIPVPNVRGMKVADAVDILSDKKLSLVKERAESSGLVAPGEIIDQRPPVGTTVKENTVVRVVVSSGRAKFIVPDLIGETRENAVNKIKGARLEVGNIIYIEDDTVAKDTVITQVPDANKGLDAPGKVDLLISSGPRGSAFPMPDVTDKSLEEARVALAKLGVTDIAVEPADAATGRVVEQEPLVGKQILQSQRVVLKLEQ
jgi:beta-lactam-binding protein with PASTA domain